MRLNELKPAEGARTSAKRVGRGIGSGLGKTSGRGHKGQKARSGGYHKVGFEGGQMPLQRRLPKRGFRSLKKTETARIRLADLAKVDAEVIDLQALKNAKLANDSARSVKIFLSGELTQPVTIKAGEITLSAGAKQALEAVGGSLIEK